MNGVDFTGAAGRKHLRKRLRCYSANDNLCSCPASRCTLVRLFREAMDEDEVAPSELARYEQTYPTPSVAAGAEKEKVCWCVEADRVAFLLPLI